ncbi:hypothetical protein [Roseicitreum antarcticum]|uniref:Uncharacterized protein n=1 Tax=Roseicitreum antarcticum TaxID=564137 RepID=A0A1H3D0Y7_9RHOB|nr:hypothetical protein [Roseicitreum antarcticum]SDX59996.1 hypothetical protein SAMN04488238_11145 [Roseicitreum antarcticum]
MTPRKIELFVPAIPPFTPDLAVDTALFVSYAKALLAAVANVIPAIKAAVAAKTGDVGFARVRPPFVASGPAQTEAIDEAVRLAGPQDAR